MRDTDGGPGPAFTGPRAATPESRGSETTSLAPPQALRPRREVGLACGLPSSDYSLGKLRPREGKRLLTSSPFQAGTHYNSLSVPRSRPFLSCGCVFNKFAPSGEAEAGKRGEQSWALGIRDPG